MSELTTCNYCDLRRLKKRAAKNGSSVVIQPNLEHGGTDVFVVPEGEKPDREKHFVAWMAAITDRCAC